jgi:hypothetical protein
MPDARACAFCGGPMEGKAASAMFCSRACKGNAFDARRRKTPEGRAAATSRMQRWRENNPQRAAELQQQASMRRARDPERQDRARAASRAWYHRNRERAIDSRLQARYGITLADYKRMHEAQNGVCAICNRPPNGHGDLHVDHDHATGYVRGLLCFSCNYAIGALQDDPGLLDRAAAYLHAARQQAA